jgi:aryl-alcohol dehydrogenase-like predicted oxidoreductase
VNAPTPEQQIALGTAQFGLDYGITNRSGQVCPSESQALLKAAWDGGIRVLDTAPAYGNCESLLGASIQAASDRAWRIVTKTLPLKTSRLASSDLSRVDRSFSDSLARLKVDAVDTLLVHHAPDLLNPGGDRLWEWMISRKQLGHCQHLGISIYSREEALSVLDRFDIDVVQLPASLADQRLLRDGTVARLHQAGVAVHVRSLFLQGVLLSDPAFIAEHFPAQSRWATSLWAEYKRQGITPLQACIGFFRAQPEFSFAVIGVTCESELTALLAAWDKAPRQDWSHWAADSPTFTDPRQWRSA